MRKIICVALTLLGFNLVNFTSAKTIEIPLIYIWDGIKIILLLLLVYTLIKELKSVYYHLNMNIIDFKLNKISKVENTPYIVIDENGELIHQGMTDENGRLLMEIENDKNYDFYVLCDRTRV